MMVIQKLKIKQEFSFAIILKCLHSILLANLVEWNLRTHDEHIQ